MAAMGDTHLLDDLGNHDAESCLQDLAMVWRRTRVACASAMEQAWRRGWAFLSAHRGLVMLFAKAIEVTRLLTVYVSMLSALIEWALYG